MIYPAESDYGARFKSGPIIKPLVQDEQMSRSTRQLKYSKFGVNLGPSNPVVPVNKYVRQ